MARSLKTHPAFAAPVARKVVNHVILCVDVSSSMRMHADNVTKSVESLRAGIMQNMGNDVRLTVYTFGSQVSRVTFQEPIVHAPVRLPSAYGDTALLDAIGISLSDAVRVPTPSNEDHLRLLYVVTDGEENCSRHYNSAQIRGLLERLDDSWTIACMVPNAQGVHYAKSNGFPAGNIEIWNAQDADGYEHVEKSLNTSVETYTQALRTGVRSTKTLFQVNAADISKDQVKKSLTQVSGRIYVAQKDYVIRDFVEKMAGSYSIGSAFYELKKKETIQANKQIVIVPVGGKKGVKYGGQSARDLLKIPNHEVKVDPADLGQWRIFVQSTSVNRKLPKGTSVFVKD